MTVQPPLRKSDCHMDETLNAPAASRPLGRSRRYTQADLPARLQQWHAPRANRWEHLYVDVGPLHMQCLDADGVHGVCLHSGDSRWIGSGMRWRIVELQAQTCFQLAIHADDAAPVNTPQLARVAWLDDAECVQLADIAALTHVLATLRSGEQRLLRGGFDPGTSLRMAIAAEPPTLFWHPLASTGGSFTAFIARAAQPISLLDYLGRDHAVIEATLAGALRGEAKHVRWLRTALGRHLAIEEGLLFPAYLRAGGREGWVRGLCNEHGYLRRQLQALSEPEAQRKFLLLLDGHDEKEEQLVYPEILERLGDAVEAMTRAIMLHPAPLLPD